MTELHKRMLSAIDAYFSAANRDEEIKAEDMLLDVQNEIRKQPAQQPVAWLRKNGFRFLGVAEPQDESELPLYTNPPAQPQQEPVAWCPDVCPITGLPFFMWIEHHKTGQDVPTYGGPYDSYTIPVRDKDGSYCRERYDHDLGGWLTDEVEDVGIQIVSDQAYVSDDEPPASNPLTEIEIRTIRRDMAGTLDVQYVAFARAIEAAHGIGEKK
jgi:hypothetical protein